MDKRRTFMLELLISMEDEAERKEKSIEDTVLRISNKVQLERKKEERQGCNKDNLKKYDTKELIEKESICMEERIEYSE